MKILLTGAAGSIASHLAERLVDLGHSVRALDRFADYYRVALKRLNADQIKDRGMAFLELDLTEDDLSGAVRDVNFVYHSAAQPGISSTTPFETAEVRSVVVEAGLDVTYDAESLTGGGLFIGRRQ